MSGKVERAKIAVQESIERSQMALHDKVPDEDDAAEVAKQRQEPDRGHNAIRAILGEKGIRAQKIPFALLTDPTGKDRRTLMHYVELQLREQDLLDAKFELEKINPC